jgi:hypothetical protein
LENVQFGIGWDLGHFTDISVAPSAIYNFNEYRFGRDCAQIPNNATFLRLICMEEA